MKDKSFNHQQQSQSDIHPSKGWLQRAAVRSHSENEVKPSVVGESGLKSNFVNVPVQGKRLSSIQRSPLTQQLTQRMATETPSLGGGTIQRKSALPEKLKSGIENLSGYSMDNVRVHYNSDKPAQLNAHAYAQGTDIHLSPRQEKHLPHEAWHVVQQMQGRVQPTMQAKGVAINDDSALEREADLMGAKAAI